MTQEVLRPFLKMDTTAYLFSPRDAVSDFVSGKYRDSAGRLRTGKRTPGERYTVHTYHRAIQRACEVAFGMPQELRRIEKTVRKLPPAKRNAERER